MVAVSTLLSRVVQVAAAMRRCSAVHDPVEFQRGLRILVALSAVWFISACDLIFTLSESSHHHFTELNPLAATLLDFPAALLAAYKFSLLVFGTSLLVMLRRHRASETGCWMLVVAYMLLALRWIVYYQGLYSTRDNLIVTLLAHMP